MLPQEILRTIAFFIDDYHTMLNFSTSSKVCYFKDVFRKKLPELLEEKREKLTQYYVVKGTKETVGYIREYDILGDYTSQNIYSEFHNYGNIKEMEKRSDISLVKEWEVRNGKKYNVSREWYPADRFNTSKTVQPNGTVIEVTIREHILKTETHYNLRGKITRIMNWGEDSVLTHITYFGKRIREVEYTPEGTIKSEHHYDSKKSCLHGPFKKWYANGLLESTGHYKNGLFHDLWIGYSIDGKETYRIIYDEGKMIATG